MLTGPDEVERRRERIWAVPFNGGSMEDRSNFSMRIQCHVIFPPSVSFTAKRMCNPVLLGYRWMGVLSPAEQQCQC